MGQSWNRIAYGVFGDTDKYIHIYIFFFTNLYFEEREWKEPKTLYVNNNLRISNTVLFHDPPGTVLDFTLYPSLPTGE